ncbi:MAG TPA: sigma-70 family RNA polymerase sigma factor [Actinomycetota bacterium]|nr:sigma-70 family RNA polymerase sigma factor [Actinomycetota bacterium]
MRGEEATLVESIGRGDRDSFRSLVHRLGPQALGLAYRITNNRELAEEAVQEAFAEVWMRAGRFDTRRGGARQWVFTLVHHKAVDAIRREASAVRLAEHVPDPAPSTDPEEHGWVMDRRDRVRRALDQLTPAQREAIQLAYFGGLTYRQVAERLGIPEGTAKSRLRDGLITLRGLMEAEGVEVGRG